MASLSTLDESGLPPFDKFFDNLIAVPIVAEETLPPSRVYRKWPEMDEMALYEVRIKSGDVIGACGQGFGPI